MCSCLEDLRGTAQAFPSESKERFGGNMGSWSIQESRLGLSSRVRWPRRVVTPDPNLDIFLLLQLVAAEQFVFLFRHIFVDH